jgi:hypothetical protein
MLSFIILSVMLNVIMLSVIILSVMLNAIMLSVIILSVMLNVFMLSVIILSVFTLSVIIMSGMLIVIMPSVVAPERHCFLLSDCVLIVEILSVCMPCVTMTNVVVPQFTQKITLF